jgi:hypothetical protein
MRDSCHNKAYVIKVNALKRPILFGITKENFRLFGRKEERKEERKDKSFEQEGLHVSKKLKTHLT